MTRFGVSDASVTCEKIMRGLWHSFQAVESATLDVIDWFNNYRLLTPIKNRKNRDRHIFCRRPSVSPRYLPPLHALKRQISIDLMPASGPQGLSAVKGRRPLRPIEYREFFNI